MTNNRKTTTKTAAITLAALAIAAVTGCSASNNKTGSTARLAALEKEIRANPAPELATRYERPVDVHNALTIYFDVNGRTIMQDAGRVWYTDRPSRLTREPNLFK